MLSVTKKENKYFIAFIPPSPVYEEALVWKQFFKDHYQSKAALNSPPHITLHMPFLWKEEKENQLIDGLSTFAQHNNAIQIVLNNFSCFAPRVIFIDVEMSSELLLFQKEMERFCKRTFQLFHADYRDSAYHPHLTLAFRDLKKHLFAKAWAEVEERKFAHTFLADRFMLLKHNGSAWDVFKEFNLRTL